MSITIALAGNPNSGKTTLFNALTGSTQYVGNWPGVTVEKKTGKLKKNKEVQIVDLPGIYSLSPYSLEEVVARDYLMQERPDVILNIVDATNLERNLYLSTQLLETGIPVVLALNMMDVIQKNGDCIQISQLKKGLACPVVPISALKGGGCQAAAQLAIQTAQQKGTPVQPKYSDAVEAVLQKIQDSLPGAYQQRWYAIKLFECDENLSGQIGLSATQAGIIKQWISDCENQMDDDSVSILTNERYQFIAQLMQTAVQRKDRGQWSASDKIDRVLTNRWLALPIFAAVMFLVYFVSISWIGGMATDWVNDTLFGEWVPNLATNGLTALGAADWIQSLVVDGVIGGVGAVLGFLPQMLVLFLFLAILEDCGYMARVAFIMDRIFRKFGLSGKSFIPLLIGTGCSVPAIMASRTVENERDRRITVITTPFIPCGAKLPIISMIAGALFGGSALVATSAYFIGVAAVIVSGIMLKKTKPFAGDPAPFVMELPAYHVPGAKGLLIHMWDRAKSFIKKAGTIIFLASVVIWTLQTFNWRFQMVEMEESMLAGLGNILAPLFVPLGWGNWRSAVAAVTGLVAKEGVVSTFGILYGGMAEVSAAGDEIWAALAASYTPLSGFSFLLFNLLCAPCFAAIGAIHREMGHAKWTWFAVGYQCVFAYVISLLVFQLGSWVMGGSFGIATAIAIMLFAALLYLLFRPNPQNKQKQLKRAAAVQETEFTGGEDI